MLPRLPAQSQATDTHQKSDCTVCMGAMQEHKALWTSQDHTKESAFEKVATFQADFHQTFDAKCETELADHVSCMKCDECVALIDSEQLISQFLQDSNANLCNFFLAGNVCAASPEHEVDSDGHAAAKPKVSAMKKRPNDPSGEPPCAFLEWLKTLDWSGSH